MYTRRFVTPNLKFAITTKTGPAWRDLLGPHLGVNLVYANYRNLLFTNECLRPTVYWITQVLLIDDLADTCFTLLNAVTQLVRVGGARAVYVFVTHAVMSQMPQVTKIGHELT